MSTEGGRSSSQLLSSSAAPTPDGATNEEKETLLSFSASLEGRLDDAPPRLGSAFHVDPDAAERQVWARSTLHALITWTAFPPRAGFRFRARCSTSSSSRARSSVTRAMGDNRRTVGGDPGHRQGPGHRLAAIRGGQQQQITSFTSPHEGVFYEEDFEKTWRKKKQSNLDKYPLALNVNFFVLVRFASPKRNFVF